MVFCPPRRGGNGKPFGKLIDEVFWRTVSYYVGNIEDFQVGIHQEEGGLIDFLLVEKIDNRLVEILLKFPASVAVAIRQFCRQFLDGKEEIFRFFQFSDEVV